MHGLGSINVGSISGGQNAIESAFATVQQHPTDTFSLSISLSDSGLQEFNLNNCIMQCLYTFNLCKPKPYIKYAHIMTVIYDCNVEYW